MKANPDFSSIQFIGTQRSGSNLLRVMLNQLPEISAPHPPHILKTFFPILSYYGDLSSNENFHILVTDVCDWVNANPVIWDGIFLSPKEVKGKCKKRNLIEIFRIIHELKAEYDGARFWCCKSMESVLYTNQLEEHGINPFYIHLYRDGRDVALSFLNALVGPKHIYQLAEKWNYEQNLSLDLQKQIPSERFISVKYEDLIRNPEGVLMYICKRLGVQYDRKVLDYFRSKESLNTAKSGAMWKNLSLPIIEYNHHKFLKMLSREDLSIFEFVAGDMLERLGYERTVKDHNFLITGNDIKNFNLKNEENIRKSRLAADPEDISKRKRQEDILSDIHKRYT